MSIIKFTGIFDKYTPVNSEPHYVFKTENKYIIKCQDHPDLISELSPEDLVNITKNNNLELIKIDGVFFNLLKNEWVISKDQSVNYISQFKKI